MAVTWCCGWLYLKMTDMKAIIVTIGDEILMGQILDTNSRFIARELTGVGMEVEVMWTVADGEEAIREAVEVALSRVDVVVVTGGLGPTKDDVTKRVLAGCFGMPLEEDAAVLAWVERLLADGGMRMNEGNRGQAMVPRGCRVLMNRKGTAPGMWFEREGRVLVALPGVPFEMEDLMKREVVPALKTRWPRLLLDYRVVKVYDIPESELAILLSGWEERLPRGLGLAYLPSPGWVKLRLTARGEVVDELDGWFENLKLALDGLRFTEGEDTSIERELGALLMVKGRTLATAESCTGGNVAALLTSVPGASGYFRGSVVAYANEVKERVLGVSRESIEREGAVSETVVRQMAEGVRRLMNTDYGVATSGVAGPTGGTPEKPVGTVWIAVASSRGTAARCYSFSFTRERNIGKASMKALEMVMEEVNAG